MWGTLGTSSSRMLGNPSHSSRLAAQLEAWLGSSWKESSVAPPRPEGTQTPGGGVWAPWLPPSPALLWALQKRQASPFPSPGLRLQGCSAGQFEAQSPSRQEGREGGGTSLFPSARHDGPRQPTDWAVEQPLGLST